MCCFPQKNKGIHKNSNVYTTCVGKNGFSEFSPWREVMSQLGWLLSAPAPATRSVLRSDENRSQLCVHHPQLELRCLISSST